MPIRVGTRLGAYQVTGLLGSGGMGEIYRARDTNLKRDVALKALPPALANDADRLARLQREAEVLASLNHPNIAHIYGLERGDGTTALAMELIEGPTLEDRISQGRIPVQEALRVANQIADALEAAHERGIVHRDLKPTNIKLRSDGTVKVLDFGIAKALDTRATGPGPAALTTPAMTEAGMILGTAAYMSPEQARGKPVDRRTDVWAFGCVLYEMLTGRAAFLGEDVTSTLARVLQGSADLSALPSDTPAPVRRTLELCLEKDARNRIADMHDVTLGLAGAFAPTAPTSARVQPLWRRMLPFAATLVAGLLLASVYFLGTRPPAVRAGAAAPAPISRFVITPPATAPLANQGSIDLAISPDGRRIAYLAVKPENGRIELYVRELDALEARPIPGTEAPNIGLWNPFFSPDGRSIGYVAPNRGLVGVALDGRPPTRIADGPDLFFGAWWAGDNTVIYSTPLRLQRVSAAGGGTPVPLMPERQTGAVGVPVLLPGGRAVLFHVVGGNAGRHVAVLDLDTGNEKSLIEGGSFPVYVDTGHLVFFRGETLMAVPFSVAELAVTGEPVALVQGIRQISGGAPDFALSANGTLAYVQSAAEATPELAVVWVDRTGTVTGRAVPDLVANPRTPRLSPDGQRLLLVTGPENNGDLWSFDLSGRPPIPLELPSDNRSPVWSPDGLQVAFHTLPMNATVVLTADGSERAPRSLSTQLYLYPYGWSPAGELLVTRFTNRVDIAAIPVAAADEVRDVVASDSSESGPALSPSGRWLAYVSDRSGRNEIWVQRYPEGGAAVRVSSGGGYEPLWSTDGRELFYWQDDAVMAVAVESGSEFSFAAPERLFLGSGSGVRGYDVARDGRFVVILPEDESREAPPASIVVVQNFGEELKQRVRPSP